MPNLRIYRNGEKETRGDKAMSLRHPPEGCFIDDLPLERKEEKREREREKNTLV